MAPRSQPGKSDSNSSSFHSAWATSSCPRPTAGGSDTSASAVPDADFLALDDDRHRTAALGELQHLAEEALVFLHVVVLHLIALSLVGLTGRHGVGSTVLTEDSDGLGHEILRDGILAPGPGAINARRLWRDDPGCAVSRGGF